MVTACWTCNGKKGRLTLEEYRLRFQFQNRYGQIFTALSNTLSLMADTPFEGMLQEALDWTCERIPIVKFHGEQERAEEGGMFNAAH
jgi:hypothetical protein